MAELIKYHSAEVLNHIRHNFRELPAGKSHGNESIAPDLSSHNYSLLKDRCQTADTANQYRKDLEKELFRYKRKNLVHAVEIVVQCPDDCPAEQKEDFFKETYSYICSTLPMGERCIFAAEVHTDERHYSPTGKMISKDHLHLMYTPAVPDKKHEKFEYRLCADELTKKARLKQFHPGLQKHLDEAGIKATVYRKKESEGKAVSLSVSQLKKLTKKTGIKLDHTLTEKELSSILQSGLMKEQNTAALEHRIQELEQELSKSHSREQKLAEKIGSLEKNQAEKQTLTWGQHTAWERESGWGHPTTTFESKEDIDL